MDWAEQHAEAYLRTLSRDIVHEPDGNIPPDFLLDGRVAVEVRRLNQHEDTSGQNRGLEETSIPIWQGLTRLLGAQGPPQDDGSWWVFLNYRRPLSSWPTLRLKVEAALQSFRGLDEATHAIQIEPTLELELRRAGITGLGRFMPGGYHDEDSGGWVLAEVLRNLQICVDEKTLKIAPYRARYPEWWLVLTDHIGLSLQEFERNILRETPLQRKGWDKIILINPRDHAQAFEI